MPVIHNRGKKVGDKTIARKIIFPKGFDEHGKPLMKDKAIIEEILMPGQSKHLSDEQYAHLKPLFPDELINIEDIKEMQNQFKKAPAAKPREGYVAPEDVDAMVEKRVKEALNKVAPEKEDVRKESREELIELLDMADRGDLIAIIEKEGLAIEAKNYKAPGALKAAILTALENKQAAEAA